MKSNMFVLSLATLFLLPVLPQTSHAQATASRSDNTTKVKIIRGKDKIIYKREVTFKGGEVNVHRNNPLGRSMISRPPRVFKSLVRARSSFSKEMYRKANTM